MHISKLLIAAAFCVLAAPTREADAQVMHMSDRLEGHENPARLGYDINRDPDRQQQSSADPMTLESYMVTLRSKNFASQVLDFISDKSDDTEEPGAIVSKKETWDVVQKVFYMQATRRIVHLLETDEEMKDMVKSIEPDFLNFVSASNSPTWGLDRIDQAKLPLNGKYNSGSLTGAGQCIYVIDTGVEIRHDELKGHAEHGYDFVENDYDATDLQGHGTHCAGTAGGKTKGVAPGATIIGVRVLDENGSGYTSTVIKGVNWAAADAKKRGCGAVLSISLGGGKDNAMNAAIEDALESGVIPVVAAGNENRSACNYSPSSAGGAVTVGSMDSKDDKSWFSNWGECIDIFAPGSYVDSADYRDLRGFRTMSGTSMATPHVAGAFALMLEMSAGTGADQYDVIESLLELGAEDVLPDEDMGYGESFASNLVLQVPKSNSTPPPTPPPTFPPVQPPVDGGDEKVTCEELTDPDECKRAEDCYYRKNKQECRHKSTRKKKDNCKAHKSYSMCAGHGATCKWVKKKSTGEYKCKSR